MASLDVMSLPSTDAPAVERAQGSLYFMGTATVILRYAGFTILTDPNFLHRGDHVHLGYGLKATRRTNPAMEMEALPPIDFVLLSHLHEDHFDREVARKLDRDLPIVSTPHAVADLSRQGFRAARALRTWDTLTLTKGSSRVRVTAMPGVHAPRPFSRLLPPVMGSLVEFENTSGGIAFRLYISGDTLFFEELKEIPQRFPNIDLALLHLGGTSFLGMVALTMDPKQGVEMIRLVKPRTAIPIHYDDYTVFRSALGDTTQPPADDPPKWWKGTTITPFAEFIAQARNASPGTNVHILHRGETYAFEIPENRR